MVTTSVVKKGEIITRDQTLEFLKFESEHSSMGQAPSTLVTRDADKVCSNESFISYFAVVNIGNAVRQSNLNCKGVGVKVGRYLFKGNFNS